MDGVEYLTYKYLKQFVHKIILKCMSVGLAMSASITLTNRHW